MKAFSTLLLFQLLYFTSFSQDFEIYRIYDLVTFSGDDISGTVFDTTAVEDGSVVTVQFGLINRTGELQRSRIERDRIVHDGDLQDAFSYASGGGAISFSLDGVTAEDLFTPDVDLFSIFANDGDSIILTCFYDIGEINECSYFRYYVIDDFDVRLDSIDVNFCQFGLSIKDVSKFPMTIFPNPTSDFIQLNYPAEWSTNSTVQLTDLNGKKLLSAKLDSTLDLSSFAAGVYVLMVTDTDTQELVFKEKIIIE